MFTIPVRNVHCAYPEALNFILEHCVRQSSRNGDVYVSPGPVATVYERPWERVVFWEERDANPYFHFMEALGFLGGIADVEFYARYARQIRNYSDDGVSLPASYGVRWRHYFGRDQLAYAVRRLRANPNDRRVVIAMYDGFKDPDVAEAGGKDIPCNTHIYLNIFEGQLNMMVCNRSNDAMWGAYGANAVHMSFLHEYLSRAIRVQQGWMIQNSFNWHVYLDFYKTIMNDRSPNPDENLALRHNMTLPFPSRWDPYSWFPSGVQTFPIMEGSAFEHWDRQLAIFLAGGTDESDGLVDPFFTTVAIPLRESHAAYREKRYTAAKSLAECCAAQDWQRAALEWLDRRRRDREAKPLDPQSGPVA